MWSKVHFLHELTAAGDMSTNGDETKPINISLWSAQGFMRPHPSLSSYRLLMVTAGGGVIFLSGVTTGKLPLIK